MAYTTQAIRNVALVGPAGAGKTTLLESLLLSAGAIRHKGSVQRGTTVSDFDAQEKRLQHSLDPAVCSVDHASTHINLIDTPGYPDFLGRTLSALEAVESVAVVLSAAAGIDSVTQRLMEFARSRELCRLIVINRIDSREAKPADLLRQIREVFGPECLPLNLPSPDGSAVVDCFFHPDGNQAAQAAQTQIVDQIVELDEQLMSVYLEQGAALSSEQLHDPFERALREGHLIPVCFVSAETGAGIPELLEIFERLLPNPSEGNPPHFLNGDSRVAVVPDRDRHVVAHVFKVTIDPYVGKLGFLRVHQGTLRSGTLVFVGNGRKPVKISHLYKVMGKDTTEIAEAIPGDICVTPKIEELQLDAVIHNSHEEDDYHLEAVRFPPPMLGIAIEPERRGDEQRLADALHKLTAEDPCVRIEHHPSVNETVLYGMGEFHVRVLLERMSERYGVRIKTHPPSIPYRETITRAAEGHCRHKKQTGGAGQFGEVFLRVEALQRGSGFQFVDEVVGGSIPGQFIPAVEKGVRQVLTEGALAGFPMQDLRVVVHDGKHHPVDSKEVAFVAAGRKAFLDAVQKASPIVLEPVVRLEITVPSGAVGGVTGDLATKRAHINSSMTLSDGNTRLTALVPLSEVSEYQLRLKALTGGEGAYQMELSHYDPVLPRRQLELVQAWRPRSLEE